MTIRPRAARAFTLMELLVVVAVIGILAALLLPALSSASERGRRAVCIGQLRQLGLAVLSYAHDNLDQLPSALATNRGRGPAIYLPLIGTNTQQFLLRYLGNSNVLDCPNLRPIFKRQKYRDWRWPENRSEMQIGYFYLGGRPDTPWSDIRDPVRDLWLSPQNLSSPLDQPVFTDLSYAAACVNRVVIAHGRRGVVAWEDETLFQSEYAQPYPRIRGEVGGVHHARLDGSVMWVAGPQTRWRRASREDGETDNNTCVGIW